MEQIEFIRAIDARRLQDLIGQPVDALFEHEDAKSANHDRQHQGNAVILQSGLEEHRVSRDNCNRPGNHHRHQNAPEKQSPATETIFAKYEAANRADVDNKDGDDERDKDAICKVAQKIKGSLQVRIVLHRGLLWQQMLIERTDFRIRLE